MPSARAATLADRTVRLARELAAGLGQAVRQQDGQALGVLVEQGPDDGHGSQAGFSGHELPLGLVTRSLPAWRGLPAVGAVILACARAGPEHAGEVVP